MSLSDTPKSLVTGGAGFIGCHVARHLIEMGHDVVVIDDLSGGFIENVPVGAAFIHGSICNDAFIDDLFDRHTFDYVYHLAAYAAEGLSHFIRKFNYTNNVIGSMHLINASIRHEVKCFVFASSIAVYGRGQLPMVETTTPAPEDPYGIAKYSVELDLRAAHEMFGLNSIVFRPHNVYGIYQNIGDRYRNVIGIFMNQVLQGKDLTLFGDGTQTRAFSHISEVAPLIARSVTVKAAYNEVFNVGSDTYYDLNELAESVMTAMEKRVGLRHLPSRNEVVHAWSDHQKAKRIFGIQSEVSISDGLAEMAAWVHQYGARKSEVFSQIEITRNLPGVWLEE